MEILYVLSVMYVLVAALFFGGMLTFSLNRKRNNAVMWHEDYSSRVIASLIVAITWPWVIYEGISQTIKFNRKNKSLFK